MNQDDTPEISDLVVAHDPSSLERLPVERGAVLGALESHGLSRAIAIVSKWPAPRGVLDAAFVDGVLVRSHFELQRLSHEFDQASRCERLLRPLLSVTVAHARQPDRAPLRVVDLGAGVGYLIRALAHRAASRPLVEGAANGAPRVELLGTDFNRTLVACASDLAARERLACSFKAANAFRLEEPASIFLSTGVVHHFRRDDLAAFFRGQRDALGFIHIDARPSPVASIGSWIFHRARMREPLAVHDGILSVERAHRAAALLTAARAACPDHSVAIFDGARGDGSGATLRRSALVHVMHAVVGVRADLRDAFVHALGPLAPRLGSFQ